MIKAIVFDWGGVLAMHARFGHFAKMYAPKFGKDPDKFKKIFLENWTKARVNEMDSQLFWYNTAKFLGIDKNIFRKDLKEYFALNKDILNLLKSLKKDYKLGLLTNQIQDWLEEIIKLHNLHKIFDVIVSSYESKVAKPDILIYKQIIEKLAVNANECLYIDDFEENLPPAEKLGMRTILFKDLQQLKDELIKLGVEF